MRTLQVRWLNDMTAIDWTTQYAVIQIIPPGREGRESG